MYVCRKLCIHLTHGIENKLWWVETKYGTLLNFRLWPFKCRLFENKIDLNFSQNKSLESGWSRFPLSSETAVKGLSLVFKHQESLQNMQFFFILQRSWKFHFLMTYRGDIKLYKDHNKIWPKFGVLCISSP